jgi:hypothetical protein
LAAQEPPAVVEKTPAETIAAVVNPLAAQEPPGVVEKTPAETTAAVVEKASVVSTITADVDMANVAKVETEASVERVPVLGTIAAVDETDPIAAVVVVHRNLIANFEFRTQYNSIVDSCY